MDTLFDYMAILNKVEAIKGCGIIEAHEDALRHAFKDYPLALQDKAIKLIGYVKRPDGYYEPPSIKAG